MIATVFNGVSEKSVFCLRRLINFAREIEIENLHLEINYKQFPKTIAHLKLLTIWVYSYRKSRSVLRTLSNF